MSTHQKSTLPVLVIQQEKKTTDKKRYMFYLTTAMIWVFIAIAVIGYSRI